METSSQSEKEWNKIIRDTFSNSGKVEIAPDIEKLISKLSNTIAEQNSYKTPQPSKERFQAKEMAWNKLFQSSMLSEKINAVDQFFIVEKLAGAWENPINVNVNNKMVAALLVRDKLNTEWKEINYIPDYETTSPHPIREFLLQDIESKQLYLLSSKYNGLYKEIDKNAIAIDTEDLDKLGIPNTIKMIKGDLTITFLSREMDGDQDISSVYNILKAGDYFFSKTTSTHYGHAESEETGTYSMEAHGKTITFSNVSEQAAFYGVTSPNVDKVYVPSGQMYFDFLREHFDHTLVKNHKNELTQQELRDIYKMVNGGFQEEGKIIYLYENRSNNELMEVRKDPFTKEYTFHENISDKRAEQIKAKGIINTDSITNNASILEKVIQSFSLKTDPIVRMDQESTPQKQKTGTRIGM